MQPSRQREPKPDRNSCSISKGTLVGSRWDTTGLNMAEEWCQAHYTADCQQNFWWELMSDGRSIGGFGCGQLATQQLRRNSE